MCFKENLMLQFSWRNFDREWFLGCEQSTSSSTKTAQTINFKMRTHISNRLQRKYLPVFFLIISHPFFIAIVGRVLKAYFCMKTVKSWSFKKYLKGKKMRARLCLSLGWLHISEKKLLKTAILLGRRL